MIEQKNLTEGGILKHIVTLAIPIIASSFMHMAYNMTDIFWVGRLSANDIAAVSGAGYVLWFGFSLAMIAKIGAEVLLSQSIGKKKEYRIPTYAAVSVQLAFALSLIYSIICVLFPVQIINFIFSFNSPYVTKTAAEYIQVSSFGYVFMFINPVFNGIMNGLGDTKTPFRLLTAGIVLNVVLDPILIFGFGPIPALGARGAAAASAISAVLSFMLFTRAIFKSERFHWREFLTLGKAPVYFKQIISIGAPIAAQITLFSIFAMLITRIVTVWGDMPVAVISIGANVEALSWMTAGGISTALSTFVGQNYGAKLYGRLAKGYVAALGISVVWGSIIALLLFLFGGDIVAIFNPNEELISIGWRYMRIVAISQVFMCIEIATTGALSGIGRTMPSAITSIGFNGLRVVAAYILAFHTDLGLDGVWWSISISSLFKGTVLVVWFVLLLRSELGKDNYQLKPLKQLTGFMMTKMGR